MRRRLEAEDLRVGEPIPCDVFDRQGRLLVRLGQIIPSERLLQRLLDTGVYGDPGWNEPAPDEAKGPPKTDVFEACLALREALTQALERIASPAQRREGVACIAETADLLEKLCERDCDAMLATILWQRVPGYAVRHQVNAAIVTWALLAARKWEAPERRPVLCAALSMNASITGLQDELYYQETPLTEAQRREIREHPARTIALLREGGVTDENWIAAVEQHHEAADGTGYPKALKGDDIGVGAQMLSAADRYCAMVSERSYRPAAPSGLALRQILLSQGKSIDPLIAALMVREIGLYPPGTAVQLANGERGVVVKRTLQQGQPIVRAVLGPSGTRMESLPKRQSSREAFRIVEAIALAKLLADITFESLWIPLEDRDGGEE